MNEPAAIPIDVLEGLRFVQASGETNMFDLPCVAQLALRAGYTQPADWLLGDENREAYVRGVLYGFPSEGEQGRANEPIKIPKEVYRGLEYVRESGETNMFDIWRVASLRYSWLPGDNRVAWKEREPRRLHARGVAWVSAVARRGR